MYQYNRKGPKRGVALYSYSAEFGLEKTLEDCFEDVHDMGAHGIEILANTHIENYPYPTEEWVEQWFRLCDKYEVVPVEYGNWIDSHVLGERDLTTEESYEMLARDIRLAYRLGFSVMRTKMPVISDTLEPVKNWREIIKMALQMDCCGAVFYCGFCLRIPYFCSLRTMVGWLVCSTSANCCVVR